MYNKNVDLNVYGEIEPVKIYVKEYIIDQKNMEIVIVVSFHRAGMHDW